MKRLYTDKKLRKDYISPTLALGRNYNENMSSERSRENCPLSIILKYNQDSDYLPFRVILDKETDFISLSSYVRYVRRPELRSTLFNSENYYSQRVVPSRQVRTGNYGEGINFFAIDNVVYAVTNYDTVVPLLGLLVKNNTRNRVSIRKDKAINEAIGSLTYDIPSDSLLFVNKDVLVKGHVFNNIGVEAKKLIKSYDFLKTVSDISIFDNMFNHKVTAPKSFIEFEEFNSTLNTHLNQLINKHYDRARV